MMMKNYILKIENKQNMENQSSLTKSKSEYLANTVDAHALESLSPAFSCR